jgi:pimeloyl-ACP methyl ester carboxylesterase
MYGNNSVKRQTVVCLHSSMSHGGQWRALANRLSGDFEVVTPDLLGYGGASDGIERLNLDDEVAAVMAKVGLDSTPWHLVGHSFGGAVALRLASLHPERVASLTVYEPVWFALLVDGSQDHVDIPEFRRIEKLLGSESLFARTRGTRDFINYWAGGDGWSLLPSEQQDRLVGLSSKVAAEFGALIAAGPATRELARLEVPTRLLCGTETRHTARRISELLAEILPRVEYYRLQGLAHMAPVTHAHDVNPLIVDHIRANSADERMAVA